MSHQTDLSLVSIEDLMFEVKTRFDSLVLYAIKVKPKGGNASLYYDNCSGDYATMIGLCEMLKDIIMREDRQNTLNEDVQI